MSERHQPKHFVEAAKDSCPYCHHTPAIWQQKGDEKVCVNCGTRQSVTVVIPVTQVSTAKPAMR